MGQITDEALELIWTLREQGITKAEEINKQLIKNVGKDLKTLQEKGLVALEGESLILTVAGEKAAQDVIRRHRLAERLMVDVLNMDVGDIEDPACQFEHILSNGVEEGICTLLGHPKECPHGLPIPLGNCCEKAVTEIESIVFPLYKLKRGEKAKIAYINTQVHPRLHKLMAFGIVPGTKIILWQKSPSFVIQVDETQVALEEQIAKDIYVRRD